MPKKTALITGASRGIGRACAIKLSNDGYNVIVNFRVNSHEANELCKIINENGGNALAFGADVAYSDNVKAMFEFAKNNFGGVDTVVNNAGIAEQLLFSDITEEKWDRMFNVNVKGVYNCISAALPFMIHNKSGRIINMSSMWGITGASCEVHYSAAKAAVIGMTKALAQELGPSGITVNAIAPGVIDTDMNSELDEAAFDELKDNTPLGRIGKAEDVAEAVSFLASDKASFITGQILSVDGGFIL